MSILVTKELMSTQTLTKRVNDEINEIGKEEEWSYIPKITEKQLINLALEFGLHKLDIGDINIYYDPEDKDWYID